MSGAITRRVTILEELEHLGEATSLQLARRLRRDAACIGLDVGELVRVGLVVERRRETHAADDERIVWGVVR